MHPKTVSPELQEKIRTTYLDYSASQAAGVFGVGKDTVLKYRAQIPVSGKSVEKTPDLQERITVTTDTQDIFLPRTRIHTLEQLLEYCEVDRLVWEVDKFTANKWEMGYVNKDGEAQTEPLYQVKAFLKRKKNIADAQKEIEALKELAKNYMPIPPLTIRDCQFRPASGNMLELLIPDLHIGKLAHAQETGCGNYDTKIAVETYRRAVDTLLERASGYALDKIVLGVGNDLLQTDNTQGTTTSGTFVDTDSRYYKTYTTARKMISETIERLRLIAPVDVKMVPGNHDALSTFTLGDSLECFFHNYPDVNVDNAPILHKIVEWGKVFLLLTHGHLGRRDDYGVWMASQYPEVFGRTLFREVHTGHRHKTSLDEKFGIRIRTLGALCDADSWHASHNFVGNLRVAEGMVWNKKQGLIAQYYHTEID